MAHDFQEGDHPRGHAGRFAEKRTPGASTVQVDVLRIQAEALADGIHADPAPAVAGDRGMAENDPSNGEEDDFNDDGDLIDESMDGDHESALASAGWGTDEDYGGYGGDDWD